MVAIHLVDGILGSLLLGLFADVSANEAGKDGLFAVAALGCSASRT